MIKKTKYILIILFICLLTGCSESSRPPDALMANNESPESRSSSENTAVAIGPAEATVQSIILLSAESSILNKGEVQWYVNDVRNDSIKGTRFSSGELRKGDVVRASVVKDDKEYRSNEIVIKNTLPVISKARLVPAVPRLSSRLTVETEADDADNDNIFIKYKWFVNNSFAGEENYLETELKKGDIIMIEVTPYDKEGPGKSIHLKNSVHNAIPVFTESTPVFDGKTYTYQITASDPDGDNLTYTIKEGPPGMTIDPAKGIITWEVPPGNDESHDVKVLVSDNNGGEILVSFTTRLHHGENDGTAQDSQPGQRIDETVHHS